MMSRRLAAKIWAWTCSFALCTQLAPVAAHGAGVPRPIVRVAVDEPVVGLTFNPARAFTAWQALGRALEAEDDHGTVFLTAAQLQSSVTTLRPLWQSGRLEIGLTCPKGQECALARENLEARRILHDDIGVFRPADGQPALVMTPRAYAQGLITILWSRHITAHRPVLAPASREVKPGDILRVDLNDASDVSAVATLLSELSSVGLRTAGATELLEDSADHLQNCTMMLGSTGGPVAPTSAAPLKSIHPKAGSVALALWGMGAPGRALVRRWWGVPNGVTLGAQSIAGLLPGELEHMLARLAPQLQRAPVNASIDRQTGQIVPDRVGQLLDMQRTLSLIRQAKKGQHLEPILRPWPARWRVVDLSSATDVLGRYRTWISGSSGRYENVRKGASQINRRLVLPGEVFSTVAAIGPTDRKHGWYRAPVIIDGDYVPGYGGGLCQVSSTLYNAVERAGLGIVERHHHARPVHYVPPGKDATIYVPVLDFRFRNTRSTPIIVQSYVKGGGIHVLILGQERAENTKSKAA